MLIGFQEISKHFKHGYPSGIIHVGAHKAEELEKYHEIGVSKIIWIEANLNLITDLMLKTYTSSGSTVHWCAAYDEDGRVIELNIANNGESSSVLNFGTHLIEHPHVHYTGKIQVPTKKIDTLIEESGFQRDFFDFVNIDIQGAELIALRGMQKQLQHVKYIYLEVNEKPLYENCALISEIDDFLKDFHFIRKITEMTRHGWGDALYVRQ